MKIIWFPIENLPERYSVQWNYWFKSEFKRLRIKNHMIYGATLFDTIRQGSFLDIVGTNYFKADQLKQFCFLVENNLVKDDDIILIHDGWFPGIEMLAYIRDALDIKFKIYSIFHAGSYDPYDFITQKGMAKWGNYLERSWFEIYDGIFVATESHKNLILASRNIGRYFHAKIHVTGLPIYPEFVQPDAHKEKIIVFPHRLDPEKQPEMFNKTASELVGWNFGWNMVSTKELCKTKQQYYNLLNKTKISVSCALQETFGIAMIESVLCGCLPIVPDRLSYSELYEDIFKYDGSFEGLKAKILQFTNSYDEIIHSTTFEYQQQFFIELGKIAIPNMINIMMGEK